MQRTGATQLRLTRPSFDTTGPDARLAELVAHLTGCGPYAAVGAVDAAMPADVAGLTLDDRLAVVAEALLVVRHDRQRQTRRRSA